MRSPISTEVVSYRGEIHKFLAVKPEISNMGSERRCELFVQFLGSPRSTTCSLPKRFFAYAEVCSFDVRHLIEKLVAIAPIPVIRNARPAP